ncbi:MAG: hypothetical protein AAFR38_11985 [Planctomycetota bacterium]
MANMGMQMPAGRAATGKASPDIFTGLMFVAVVALLGATVIVGLAGTQVAPNGTPWELQDAERIQLPNG